MKYMFCVVLMLLFSGCHIFVKLPSEFVDNASKECIEFIKIFKQKVWYQNEDGSYSIDQQKFKNSKIGERHMLTCLEGISEQAAINIFGKPNYIIYKKTKKGKIIFKQFLYYLDYNRLEGDNKYMYALYVHIYKGKIKFVYTRPKILNEPKTFPSTIL